MTVKLVMVDLKIRSKLRLFVSNRIILFYTLLFFIYNIIYIFIYYDNNVINK